MDHLFAKRSVRSLKSDKKQVLQLSDEGPAASYELPGSLHEAPGSPELLCAAVLSVALGVEAI